MHCGEQGDVGVLWQKYSKAMELKKKEAEMSEEKKKA